VTALIAAAAVVVASAVPLAALVRAVQSERREHARERGLLINQILHLSGKTWSPPPADEKPGPPAIEPHRYTANPERFSVET